MQTKQLLSLLVVAVVLCVVAVAVYQKQGASSLPFGSKTQTESTGLSLGDPLLADLDQKFDSIAKVEFSKGDDSIVLTRQGDGQWVVETLNNYPADPNKIIRLVTDLTALQVTTRLTQAPEKYEKFGLKAESGSEGTVVLSDAEGNAIVRLMRGGTKESDPDDPTAVAAGGRYLRQESDPHVYLVDENLFYLNTDVSSWVDTELAKVEADDVIGVTIDHATTDSVEMALVGRDLKLNNAKEGMQGKTSEISSVRRALSSLSLTDVLTSDSEKAKNLKFDATYTAKLKDGTIYKIESAEGEDDNAFIRLRADYGELFLTVEDKATTVATADAQKAAEAAKAAVPELNKKHGPWIYGVSSWSAKSLRKSLGDVMEAIPAPKAESAPTSALEGPTSLPQGAAMPTMQPGQMPGAKPVVEPVVTPKDTPKQTPAPAAKTENGPAEAKPTAPRPSTAAPNVAPNVVPNVVPKTVKATFPAPAAEQTPAPAAPAAEQTPAPAEQTTPAAAPETKATPTPTPPPASEAKAPATATPTPAAPTETVPGVDTSATPKPAAAAKPVRVPL